MTPLPGCLSLGAHIHLAALLSKCRQANLTVLGPPHGLVPMPGGSIMTTHPRFQHQCNTAAVRKTSTLGFISSFQSGNLYFNSETSSPGVGGGAWRQAGEVGDQGGGSAACSGHSGEPAGLWGGVHRGHCPHPHHHHQHHSCPGRYVQSMLLYFKGCVQMLSTNHCGLVSARIPITIINTTPVLAGMSEPCCCLLLRVKGYSWMPSLSSTLHLSWPVCSNTAATCCCVFKGIYRGC